jgi:hypothetical protein
LSRLSDDRALAQYPDTRINADDGRLDLRVSGFLLTDRLARNYEESPKFGRQSDRTRMADSKDIVIITGSSGFIGEALVARLAASFRVIGLDRQPPKRPPSTAKFEEIDLNSDDSLRRTFAKIRKRHGDRIASVIHLAAYFDLTGEPNPRYEEDLRCTNSFLAQRS